MQKCTLKKFCMNNSVPFRELPNPKDLIQNNDSFTNLAHYVILVPCKHIFVILTRYLALWRWLKLRNALVISIFVCNMHQSGLRMQQLKLNALSPADKH